MLTEYALTPHLFDDEHNAGDPEWLTRLRAFGDRLLPTGADRVFNTIVSDLFGASWFRGEFAPLVENLERRQEADRQTRLPALDLLKALRPRIKRHLVRRPACNSDDYPMDEGGWAAEAVASSERSGLPIHRIVASSCFEPDGELAGKLKLLGNAQDESFWDCVPPTQWPRADLAEQCATIGRMCTFYTFLSFVSPHLDVQGSTDLRFAVELVRTAHNRPTGFAPPARIHLHTKGPSEEHLRKSLVERVLARLDSDLGDLARIVRLFLWPSLLERHLLVGHAQGDSKPAVVWAVSLTHVVRPDLDGPDQDPATFAILPANRTSKLASRYYSNPSTDPYAGSPFQVSPGGAV